MRGHEQGRIDSPVLIPLLDRGELRSTPLDLWTWMLHINLRPSSIMAEQSLPSQLSSKAPIDSGRYEASSLLDHRYFPHIIDLIFASMPYPGLVNCASVCKAWREKAEPYLLSHVAIFENEDNDVVIRSRDMGWPDKSSLVIADSFMYIGVLRRVRRASIVDSFYMNFESWQALGPTLCWPTTFHRLLNPDNAAGNRQRLHRTEDISGQLGWRDVAHFIDFSGETFVFASNCAFYPTTLTLSIDCYSNPTLPEKWIFTYPEAGLYDLVSDSEVVENYTLIFKNCLNHKCPEGWFASSYTPVAAPNADRQRQSCQNSKLGAVCELLRLISTRVHINTISVVGLEEFLSYENFVPFLHEVCWDIGWETGGGIGVTVENGVPCLGEYLKFYSHHDYESMVGEERYRLLTVR